MANVVSFVMELSSNLPKVLNKSSKSITKFDQKINKLTPSIGGLGKQLLGFASVAAVGSLFVGAARDVAAYDKAMGSLSAITGAVGDQLKGFSSKIGEVAGETKASSLDVAKAFELVGSAKPELLASADALGAVTKSAITLSEASGETLESSVNSLTGALNQFGLGSESAASTIDILANGAKFGAAAIPLVSDSLDKFGTVAAGFNVTVGESVAITEALADKNLKGAEAGTALKGVLLKMSSISALPPEALKQLEKFGVDTSVVANKSLTFQERLEELSKIGGNATAMIKVFGEGNVTAAGILLNNTSRVAQLTDQMTKGGAATAQAAANNNTFTKRLEQLSSAWTNIFTSSKQATGVLGIFKDAIVFLTDNLGTVVSVVGGVVAAFLALKTGVAAVAIVTKAFAVGQIMLNTVLAMNPIGLVVIGLAALTAGLVLAFNHFEGFRNAVITAGGVLLFLYRTVKGFVMPIIESLGNFIAKLMPIFSMLGGVIVEALVSPFITAKNMISEVFGFIMDKIGQFLGFLAKIPGVGKAIKDIKNLLGDGGENVATASPVVAAVASKTSDPLGSSPLAASAAAAGGASGELSGGGTKITSAAPKTFNLTIENLVKEINNNNQTIEENMNEAANVIKSALLGALNDVQTELN